MIATDETIITTTPDSDALHSKSSRSSTTSSLSSSSSVTDDDCNSLRGTSCYNERESDETELSDDANDDTPTEWIIDHTKECNEHNTSTMYLLDRDEEDETITDLVNVSGANDQLMESSQQNRMRVAVGIILRLVLPLANGVARGLKGIRDVRFLKALRNLVSSRQALTNALAYAANTISMSLSSVQVSHRIDPLLKMMKLKRGDPMIESILDSPTPRASPVIREPSLRTATSTNVLDHHEDTKPKRCCNINILAEPPPGTPIRADIVLIHGLHGSLVNTWKQGLWTNERRPEHFERPPKPEIRPPKRPRHSRSNIFGPPHREKRKRYADQEHFASVYYDTDDAGSDHESNGFTYECGSPGESRFCDGMEYSFPSFRLRLDNHGHFMETEYESTEKKNTISKKTSVNDPNYSKCWPGDWLPLDCPGVRVIAVNYTTDQYLWRPVWKKKEPRSGLVERSREMTKLLIEHKVGYGHPIIWVGHSKGGIFIKQIIVDAWESGKLAAAPLWRSARGAFFYSVPHRGSHLASINAPLLRRSVELIDIEKNNKYLLDLHRRFVGLYQMGHLKIEVFSFVETALTLMSVLYLRIVGVDSADPGIGEVCGLHLDHRQICKPRSRDCILYKELVKMINKVC